MDYETSIAHNPVVEYEGIKVLRCLRENLSLVCHASRTAYLVRELCADTAQTRVLSLGLLTTE